MTPPDLCALGRPLLVSRVRPAREYGREAAEAAASTHHPALRAADASHVVVQAAGSNGGRSFVVDTQLWADSDQADCWRAVGAPLCAAVLSGHSASLLAVGPCGGGKRYTLGGTADAPGLAPRCLRALCEAPGVGASLRVELSMVEVLLDRAYDLLAPPAAGGAPREPLQLAAAVQGAAVAFRGGGGTGGGGGSSGGDDDGHGADGSPPPECWHAVSSFAQAEALRQFGESQRTTRPTALHERSSRGHALLMVRLTKVAGADAYADAAAAAGVEGAVGLGPEAAAAAAATTIATGGSGAAAAAAAAACAAADEAADGSRLETAGTMPRGGFGELEEWQCRLTLACLGGSERVEAGGPLCAAGLREALNLNASLHSLASALPLIAHKEAHRVAWGAGGHGPLLQLLRDSIDGRSALVVLAALPPAEALVADAISSLRLLAAARGLPVAPRRRGSAVREAERAAARRVEQLGRQAGSLARAKAGRLQRRRQALPRPKPRDESGSRRSSSAISPRRRARPSEPSAH